VQFADNNNYPKYRSASITFENILNISRKLHAKRGSVTFSGTVKQILGTANNMGKESMFFY
jgi:ribosomal protein L11